MRLYRAIGSGELYSWAGTQRDADKIGPWSQIEVPTDKPGLLEWLNGEGAQMMPMALASRINVARMEAEHEAHAAEDGRCPKCARTPRAAEQLAKGDDVEAIAEWIFHAEGFQIERVMAALGARIAELRS